MNLGGELRAQSIVGNIDEITSVDGEPTVDGAFAQGSQIAVRGWLLNRQNGMPAGRIDIQVGSGPAVEAVLGFARPDLTEAFAWAQSMLGGFYAVVPVDAETGSQPVVFTAYIDGARTVLSSDISIDIARLPDPLAALDERSEGWAFNFDGFFEGEHRLDTATPGQVATIPVESLSVLRLWIVDVRSGRPPAMLIVRCGGRFVPILDSHERLDAAESVGAPNAVRCGYDVALLAPLVSVAVVQVYALSGDGTYLRLPSLCIRQAEPFPSDFLPADAQIATSVDEIRVGEVSGPLVERVNAPRSVPIVIRGWAVDECGPRNVGGVEARVDATFSVPAIGSERRPDIASLYENTMIGDAGFSIALDTAAWPRGEHTVSLRALSARSDRMKAFAEFRIGIE